MMSSSVLVFLAQQVITITYAMYMYQYIYFDNRYEVTVSLFLISFNVKFIIN